MLATLCAGGVVHKEYLNSILVHTYLAPQRLDQQRHYSIGLQLVQGNSGLSKDRSILASSALHLGIDKLLFIDADQSWTWPQLKELLDSNKPLVAAVTPMKMRMPRALNFTPLECDLDCFEESNGVATAKGLKNSWRNIPRSEKLRSSTQVRE